MKREHVIILIAVAGVLVLTGVGALLYGLSQGGSLPGFGPEPIPTPATPFDIPDIEIEPPPSLAEIAAEIRPDYPELADLLENPELGSVYKDFYLAYQRGGPETAQALARQRGILNENDEIEMTLILDTEDAAPLIAQLEAEGVNVRGSFRNQINITIPVSLIEEQVQSEDPNLIVERLSELENVIRLELPHKDSTRQSLILGQGVNVTLADEWHAQGLTGEGIKVGVIDLGFGGYQDMLGTELPENVTVEVFGNEANFATEVHGTACAEIVHEMAPEAELFLAYYDGTTVAKGQAVEWLIDQGVDIVSNSTGSNGLTPMDGTGIDAEIVNWAFDEGIFWVNAAGNEADTHYRGTFNDGNGDTFHDFFSDVDVLPFVPVEPGAEVRLILSWDDWDNVDQDYELILLDSEGNLLAKSEEPQSGQEGHYPVEVIIYKFEDDDIYLLAVENYDGQARGDVTLDIFVEGAAMHPDYWTAEASLGSPNDARGAFSVGAVNWADDVLEFYSSQGPTADGRIKPDLAAPSVVDSASYAPEAFDGTSAAAPHVSGAAALVLEAFPDLSPTELGTFLQEQSIDLGDPGLDNAFGAGRLSLGDPPETEKPEPEEVSLPTPVAELRPTSTPRPVPTQPAVGLPVQPERDDDPAGQPATPTEDDALLGTIVIVGLCLTCVGGLVFVGLVIVGAVMMRRK